MSLTSQLSGGALAGWCAERFSGSADVTSTITAEARRVRPVRPVRPDGSVDLEHWAAIGGAFGARLAALVQPAPPYYALHGLVRAGLVSREWADEQAALHPTHSQLPAHQREMALDIRPTPAGWLTLEATGLLDTRSDAQRIAEEFLRPHASPHHRGYPAEPALADLFERTRNYQARHAPPGNLGSPGAEAGLARIFWLFNMFEEVYRSGRVGDAIDRLFRPTVPSVEKMRAAASDAVVAELVELAQRLSESGSLHQLHRLAENPEPGRSLGIAGPMFVNHWADGDLLLTSSASSTLIDVKTVAKTSDADRTTRWLWQLVAYAWLDIADRYRIRTVGLYLARHGLLLTWPLDDLTRTLLSGHDTDTARTDFRALATQVLTGEGATLPRTDSTNAPQSGPPAPFPRPGGLYMSPSDDYTSYLRFDDTRVADVSSTGSPEQVARWLHPGTRKCGQGTYQLNGRNISFTTTEESVQISYHGTVSDDAIQLILTVHSKFNGRRSQRVYYFVPVNT